MDVQYFLTNACVAGTEKSLRFRSTSVIGAVHCTGFRRTDKSTSFKGCCLNYLGPAAGAGGDERSKDHNCES
jgi:hypothetical protein